MFLPCAMRTRSVIFAGLYISSPFFLQFMGSLSIWVQRFGCECSSAHVGRRMLAEEVPHEDHPHLERISCTLGDGHSARLACQSDRRCIGFVVPPEPSKSEYPETAWERSAMIRPGRCTCGRRRGGRARDRRATEVVR